MQAERCQAILTCIFADAEVCKGLGAAEQFEGIIGEPPHGVLLMLKGGPGKHIKANRYEYQMALGKEIGKIERIKELRAQMIGLIGTAIVSGLIGIAGFISRALYSYLALGVFFAL